MSQVLACPHNKRIANKGVKTQNCILNQKGFPGAVSFLFGKSPDWPVIMSGIEFNVACVVLIQKVYSDEQKLHHRTPQPVPPFWRNSLYVSSSLGQRVRLLSDNSLSSSLVAILHIRLPVWAGYWWLPRLHHLHALDT